MTTPTLQHQCMWLWARPPQLWGEGRLLSAHAGAGLPVGQLLNQKGAISPAPCYAEHLDKSVLCSLGWCRLCWLWPPPPLLGLLVSGCSQPICGAGGSQSRFPEPVWAEPHHLSPLKNQVGVTGLPQVAEWSHVPFCLPLAILNPKQPKETPKSFSFDYSYWSHTTVSGGRPEPAWSTGARVRQEDILSKFLLGPLLSAACRHQLCISEASVPGHWRGDVATCLRRL